MDISICNIRIHKIKRKYFVAILFSFWVVQIAAQELNGELEVIQGFVEVVRENKTLRIQRLDGITKVYPGENLSVSNDAMASVYLGTYMEVLRPGSLWIVPSKSSIHTSQDLSHSKPFFKFNPREDKKTAATKGIINDIDQLYAALPSHNCIILSNRPCLIWDQNNAIYEVTIYQEETLIFKRTVMNCHYFYFPKTISSLKSNLKYYWEVTDKSNPRFSDSSVFTVASDEKREKISTEVSQLRIILRNKGYSNEVIAIEIAGYLYQKKYFHEAIQEILRAVEDNPDDSRLNFIINKYLISKFIGGN